jgi:Spy/CpxP family protein refolding chaperone
MKIATIILLMTSTLAFAQQMPHPPMGRGLGPGPGGKWWDNPEIAKRVGVTSDQKKKMDDVFLQSRMRLIDLHASLDKDELTLESLMQGPALEDNKILPAIDKIAQDRAELEKADARLLLGIRHVLTPEQWAKLDEYGGPHGDQLQGGPGGRGPGMRFHGGPGGPGGPGNGPNNGPVRGNGGPPPPPQE